MVNKVDICLQSMEKLPGNPTKKCMNIVSQQYQQHKETQLNQMLFIPDVSELL